MELNEESSSRAKLDPIEWAIVGVVIAGASLVLTVDTKIKARRKERSVSAQRRNRLQLLEMRDSLDEMKKLVDGFGQLVNLSIHRNREGITKASWEFVSEEAREKFNRSFDRLAYLISRLNRCVNEIDPDGIELDEKSEREFVAGPIARIKRSAEEAILPSTDPAVRMELVKGLIFDAGKLVAALGEILG